MLHQPRRRREKVTSAASERLDCRATRLLAWLLCFFVLTTSERPKRAIELSLLSSHLEPARRQPRSPSTNESRSEEEEKRLSLTERAAFV